MKQVIFPLSSSPTQKALCIELLSLLFLSREAEPGEYHFILNFFKLMFLLIRDQCSGC